MKLSMWMIANQISELDIKLEIREEAPAVLNSAALPMRRIVYISIGKRIMLSAMGKVTGFLFMIWRSPECLN